MDESKYVKTLNKSIYIYKQIICSKYIAFARTMARTGLSFVVTVSQGLVSTYMIPTTDRVCQCTVTVQEWKEERVTFYDNDLHGIFCVCYLVSNPQKNIEHWFYHVFLSSMAIFETWFTWVKQCHKPSPSHRHKYVVWINHSQSWVVYGIDLPTIPQFIYPLVICYSSLLKMAHRNSCFTYYTWGRGWMTKASGVGERRKGRGELRRDCHHRVAALFVPTRMQQWYMIYDI